jgi:hypothetical protein
MEEALMKTFDPQTAAQKYDEINRLETRTERMELLHKESEEMKVALWLENIDRKTKGKELSAEQQEILEVIKEKFITVEFFESAKGKGGEEEAGEEYSEIMGRASRLLGREMMSELLGIMGDSQNMKCS